MFLAGRAFGASSSRPSLLSHTISQRTSMNRAKKKSMKLFLSPKEPYSDLMEKTALPETDHYEKKMFPYDFQNPPPEPGRTGTHHKYNLKEHSDTWASHTANDGNGSRLGFLNNFHWKSNNSLDLEQLRSFNMQINRLDQANGFWLGAVMKAPYGYDFCPGANLLALARNDEQYRTEFHKLAQETAYKMATMKTTGISCIQGNCMGLGAGLTSHSVIRLATEGGVWAVPQTMHGAVPDMGMTYLLPRLKNDLGMFLALTGKRVETTDLYLAGLATHVMPLERLDRFEIETSLINDDSINHFYLLFKSFTIPYDEDTTPSALKSVLPHIDRTFNKTSLEDVFKCLEETDNDWARATLARLQKASPLMLHLTFRLQRIGRYLKTLEECLHLEWRVMQKVLKTKDYYEGLIAYAAESRPAVWEHESIYDVPQELIESFFLETEIKLDLEATTPGVVPMLDPWYSREAEIQARIHHPFEGYSVQRFIDRIMPRRQQTVENWRKLYTQIFKRGGMAEEAGYFYYKADLLYYKNPQLEPGLVKARRGLSPEGEADELRWEDRGMGGGLGSRGGRGQ